MYCVPLLFTFVFFWLTYVGAQSDDHYFLHFRRTEFYDTDLHQRMFQRVDSEVESLCGKMEDNCRFTRAAVEYENLQNTAASCATATDRTVLQNALSGFEISKDECLKRADCKSVLGKAIDKAVTSIRNIDATAWKAVTACGADNLCKYTAYNTTHTNIFNLYLASRPQLRLLADQGVASSSCAQTIVDCMIEQNEAALRSVYKGIARIQECQQRSSAANPTTVYMVLPSTKLI